MKFQDAVLQYMTKCNLEMTFDPEKDVEIFFKLFQLVHFHGGKIFAIATPHPLHLKTLSPTHGLIDVYG